MEGYDFHIHSIFSDGELIPAEIAHRCSVLGYKAIAITDHADNSNLEFILSNLVDACAELSEHMYTKILPGIEITYAPAGMLEKLVSRARELGAKVILVHGETPVEPVPEGTNAVAVEIAEVDILAHPGFITRKEAEQALENNIYLELSARRGHSLANGHVARIAQETGAKLLVNTDAHSPEDLIPPSKAIEIATASGLPEELSKIITSVNPKSFIGDL
ncbi:MAG: histidinol phosphate phosphatase domain-containing protein [Candidatus Hydrothermarchaeales archaeon]